MASPNHCAILVENLHKTFRDLVAVDDLSFQVHRGEIFGMLGPNGAGKTTTIRMLLDLIKPDAGTAYVLGQLPGQVRHRVGYLPEERGLYANLHVNETLEYLGQLKGMSRAHAQKRAAELLERVELSAWAKHKVQELSRGMHQKLQIIASLIHDPDLIILDEPFQGLDPVNVELVKKLIRDLRAQGKTITLSAHEMSQVEALCERILLIDHGKPVLYGKLADIKKQFAPHAIEIVPSLSCDGWTEVIRTEMHEQTQWVYLTPATQPRDFLKKILEQGWPVEQFGMASIPLDQIFIQVVQGKHHGHP